MEDKQLYSYDTHLDDSVSLGDHPYSCLPHLTLPLSCPNTLVLDTLSAVFSPTYHFLSLDNAILVLVQKKTLLSFLCHPCSTNVFHCQVKVDNTLQCKMLLIRSVLGDYSAISVLVKKVQGILDKNRHSIDTQLEEPEEAFLYSTECTAYSHFHEVMINNQYHIGKQLQAFLDTKKTTLSRDLTAKECRALVLDVYFQVRSVEEQLSSDFNYLKDQSKRVLDQCRPAVERFIYTHVLFRSIL